MYKLYSQKGTSLIETIVAVGIFSLFITAATTFLLFVLTTQEDIANERDLGWQANLILRELENRVGEAEYFMSPDPGSEDDSLLIMNKSDASVNDVTFIFSNNNIFVQEETNTPHQLNSALIKVHDVSFENLSFAEVEVMRISLELYIDGIEPAVKTFTTSFVLK